MIIRKADLMDLDEVNRLGELLWPDSENLKDEFREIILSSDAVIYIAVDEVPIGFSHFALRRDYVNGCSDTPTGYLEGIYVEEAYRNKGIAKKLVNEGQLWSKSLGAREMGSDVLIDNEDSMKFHEKIGFKEVERVVCYIREIKE